MQRDRAFSSDFASNCALVAMLNVQGEPKVSSHLLFFLMKYTVFLIEMQGKTNFINFKVNLSSSMIFFVVYFNLWKN